MKVIYQKREKIGNGTTVIDYSSRDMTKPRPTPALPRGLIGIDPAAAAAPPDAE